MSLLEINTCGMSFKAVATTLGFTAQEGAYITHPHSQLDAEVVMRIQLSLQNGLRQLAEVETRGSA